MDSITLENYRCFREKQEVRLAPLTLLVGENSTGKTSFLALIHALLEIKFGGIYLNFKKEPYDLGSFDEIVHYRGEKSERAQTFKVKFDFTIHNHIKFKKPELIKSSYEIVFSPKRTAPFPVKRRLDLGEIWVEEEIVTENSQEKVKFHLGINNASWKSSRLAFSLMTSPYSQEGISPAIVAMRCFLYWKERIQEYPESPRYEIVEGHSYPSDNDIKLLEKYISMFRNYTDPFSLTLLRDNQRYGRRVLPSAPIRSKPGRTYDPGYPGRDPEGVYLPSYLADIWDEENNLPLQEALQNFGKASGLFDEISVRYLGEGRSGPFQIQIKEYESGAEDPKRNLIDVGYGVSQILPPITEILDRIPSPIPSLLAPVTFLLQQPEIHLHPKAQAALGSFFSEVASSGHNLVVETHSDYILDRIRMEVRADNPVIKPEDVSILYFDRENLDVTIHSLELDKYGDIIDAPPTYREFFRKETRDLLGM